MTTLSPREQEDERRLAERAAEWVQLLPSASDAERAEFADWLAESPRHVEEFLVITALDREVRRLPLKERPGLRELLHRSSNAVVPLRPSKRNTQSPRSTSRASRWVAGFVAVIVPLVVLGWLWHSHGQSYSTNVGEQRMVVLSDGSQMSMTGGTRTRVRFSSDVREIELVAGEALFKVAKQAQRPFIVRSGHSAIQAIGTQFNVLRRPSGTTVSVLEGAVQVEGLNGVSKTLEAPPTTLRAGDEVRITTSGRLEKQSRSAERTTATWNQRRLVFRADNLLDIASEFNRYNRAPRLIVDDSAANAPRYTGVFDADDPRSLLAFLREDPQITLEERGNELVIRARQ